MRVSIWIVLAFVAVPGGAVGDTLFEKRTSSQSIQTFQKHLLDIRSKLYSEDDDDREDAFELIEESLDEPPQKGDSEFALQLLGDLMLESGRPAGGEIDVEIQEEGLGKIIENALGSDFSFTRREFALGQLRRIVRARRLRDSSFLEDIFEALTTLSENPNLVLAHGALNALGPLSTRGGGEAWLETGEEAAEILLARMESDNFEIRRIAMMETIGALHGASAFNDTGEELWEGLTEAVGDLESPTFFRDLRPHLNRLAERQLKSAYEDQAQELNEALKDFDNKISPTEDPFPEILVSLSEEEDPGTLENLLARIEAEGRGDHAKRVLGLIAVRERASKLEIAPYTLRLLLGSLLRMGRVAGSPIMFYRTGTHLLDLAAVHRAGGMSNLPLSHLARLLASTDRPGLVVPLLNRIKALARAKTQPIWIARRMVALVFLQAGDSPNEKIRGAALKVLQDIGRSGGNWAIRQEVWHRISLLARFARDEDVKSEAVRWLGE